MGGAFFERVAHSPGDPNFYYTTDPTICQEKNAKKNKKIIFTKRLDKCSSPCYNVGTTKERK